MPTRAADHQIPRDSEAVGSRAVTVAIAATAPTGAARRQRASPHEVEPSYV